MPEVRLNFITLGLGGYGVSGCGVVFFCIDPSYIGVFSYAFLASSLLVSIQTG